MEGCPAVTGAVFLSFVFVVDLLLGKRRDDSPDNNKLPASPVYKRNPHSISVPAAYIVSVCVLCQKSVSPVGFAGCSSFVALFLSSFAVMAAITSFNTFVLILSLFIIIMPISSRYKTATIPNPEPGGADANPPRKKPKAKNMNKMAKNAKTIISSHMRERL